MDLYRGRNVTFDMWVQSDGTSLQSSLLTLAAPTVVGRTTEQPLWFQVASYPLLCVMARPRKRTTPWDLPYAAAQVAKPTLTFHCTDPRAYAATQTATVDLPTPTGGLTFPVTFPASFGSATPNGVTVANSGNTQMYPVLVITGPVTNPTIQNASITGTPALTFSNPTQTSYTVLAGDQLVVDLDMHTVLYYSGGVASGTAGADRRSWLVSTSTWWDLPPGNNLIQFNSNDSSQTGATVEIQWASAFEL